MDLRGVAKEALDPIVPEGSPVEAEVVENGDPHKRREVMVSHASIAGWGGRREVEGGLLQDLLCKNEVVKLVFSF